MIRTAIFLFLLVFHSFAAHARNCEDQKSIESYKPLYAKFFKIEVYKKFKILESMDDKIIVADETLDCTTSLPIIKSKASRIVATSTTHLSFLSFLHMEKNLVGFQGVSYIYGPLFDRKKIKDIDFNLNPEELLSLKPDLIIAYRENLRRPERLGELRALKLPVVLNNELEENHPLARAEWAIFLSAFVGKEKEAIAHFHEIAERYEKTKSELVSASKVNVLVGDIQNGSWVTCGSASDLAILIKDAGGKLALEKLTKETSQTQTLALEKVLLMKDDVNVWLPQNTWLSKVRLLGDSRYKKFSRVKIYNNVNKLNSKGFNDYWETGIARPDLLIADFVKIFHPEKYPKAELIWYKEIQ